MLESNSTNVNKTYNLNIQYIDIDRDGYIMLLVTAKAVFQYLSTVNSLCI